MWVLPRRQSLRSRAAVSSALCAALDLPKGVLSSHPEPQAAESRPETHSDASTDNRMDVRQGQAQGIRYMEVVA